jgi:hypothetical protein
MRTSSLIAPAALLSLANAAALAPRAFNIPDNDGFPNPTPEQLAIISKEAGGKLPGGALPSDLGPASTVAWQLITFNEYFETSYFSSLLNNLTSGAPGYTELGASTGAAEATIRTVLAVSIPATSPPTCREAPLTGPCSKSSSTPSRPPPCSRPRTSSPLHPASTPFP